jgi:hypothetical protein
MATGYANPVFGVAAKHGSPSNAKASGGDTTTDVLGEWAVPLKQGHRIRVLVLAGQSKTTHSFMYVVRVGSYRSGMEPMRGVCRTTENVRGWFVSGKGSSSRKWRRGVSIEWRKPPNS